MLKLLHLLLCGFSSICGFILLLSHYHVVYLLLLDEEIISHIIFRGFLLARLSRLHELFKLFVFDISHLEHLHPLVLSNHIVQIVFILGLILSIFGFEFFKKEQDWLVELFNAFLNNIIPVSNSFDFLVVVFYPIGRRRIFEVPEVGKVMQPKEADHSFEEIQRIRRLLKLEEIFWIEHIWDHREKLNDIKSIGPFYTSVVPGKVEREYSWLILQNVNIITFEASAHRSIYGTWILTILSVNILMCRT